jgi:hypothetical protein
MNKLIEIATNEQFPMQWSNRRLNFSQKKKFFDKTIILLDFIAGGDLHSFLTDLFKNRKLNLSEFSRETIALKKLSYQLNKRVKPKNKHFFIKCLRKSNFSRMECTKLGFKFSKHLWSTCLINEDRDVGGRYSYCKNYKERINKFLEENSEISASRTTTIFNKNIKLNKPNGTPVKEKNTKTVVNSRYINNSMNELHKLFVTQLDDDPKPSKTSFLKYSEKIFKKARRKTDICKKCFMFCFKFFNKID